MSSKCESGHTNLHPDYARNVAISVVDVSKRYHIYGQPIDRLKQFIIPRFQRLFGRTCVNYFREFSALSNISFEVQAGETVGIIGRNGAGKSTLLQIICGTLSPSDGFIQINGRVAALLELGSGFNLEFTGRENIYMNASILGLTKDEIDQRFDDIVDFAGIGDFLDQPVKTYSSGMYVRLAFSVIVHVDADILVVDEALSVGDMYFQAKCMAHIKKLMDGGVTVLFVSHDINTVKAICRRAIYLEHGSIVAAGPTESVVDAYYCADIRQRQSLSVPVGSPMSDSLPSHLQFSELELGQQREFSERASFQRIQNGMAHWLNVSLLDDQGRPLHLVNFGQQVTLRMVLRGNIDLPSVGVAYHIRDRSGFDVVYADSALERCHVTNLRAGEIVTIDWIFTASLREDSYSIAAMLSIPQDLSIGKVEVCDFVPLATAFQVSRGASVPIYGSVYWNNVVHQSRYMPTGPST